MEYKNGLSENEWFIMQVIWESPLSTLHDICKLLTERKGWTKHAITSFLKRMEAKGAIRVDTNEKNKRYEAIWDKEEMLQQETKAVLDRVYNGDMLLLVNNAVKQQDLSEEDIERLKDLINQM